MCVPRRRREKSREVISTAPRITAIVDSIVKRPPNFWEIYTEVVRRDKSQPGSVAPGEDGNDGVRRVRRTIPGLKRSRFGTTTSAISTRTAASSVTRLRREKTGTGPRIPAPPARSAQVPAGAEPDGCPFNGPNSTVAIPSRSRAEAIAVVAGFFTRLRQSANQSSVGLPYRITSSSPGALLQVSSIV